MWFESGSSVYLSSMPSSLWIASVNWILDLGLRVRSMRISVCVRLLERLRPIYQPSTRPSLPIATMPSFAETMLQRYVSLHTV
jgi:hypothetical protein